MTLRFPYFWLSFGISGKNTSTIGILIKDTSVSTCGGMVEFFVKVASQLAVARDEQKASYRCQHNAQHWTVLKYTLLNTLP